MIRRTNMAEVRTERWRPVSFVKEKTAIGRFISISRRFLDLQTASIWLDLSSEIPSVQGTAVDVGCGAQPYRELFDSRAVYIGIDSAEAKANFGYEVPETRYFSGSMWPLEDRAADFILCTETLEHVREFPGFLSEALRCLAPGGRILLTVPFAARWHYIPYDYWRFTPSGLKTLLSEAGFCDIAIYARGNSVTVACYKAMALLLPLLMPQTHSPIKSLIMRLSGLAFSPMFLILAVIGNVSLRGKGGDDCLGYTALATRPDG